MLRGEPFAASAGITCLDVRPCLPDRSSSRTAAAPHEGELFGWHAFMAISVGVEGSRPDGSVVAVPLCTFCLQLLFTVANVFSGSSRAASSQFLQQRNTGLPLSITLTGTSH